MAETYGRTLSDACQAFTEQLAEQQRKVLSQNAWLTQQANQAFEQYDEGKACFIDHESAKAYMAERKAKIHHCATP